MRAPDGLLSSWRALPRGAALLLAGVAVAGSAWGVTLFGKQIMDGWNADELAVLSTLRLSQLRAAPRDPSNAYEGSTAAVALGQRLFNDTRFSRNQAVSCASCHDAAHQFQDGRPLGQGVGLGARRTMPRRGGRAQPLAVLGRPHGQPVGPGAGADGRTRWSMAATAPSMRGWCSCTTAMPTRRCLARCPT